MCLRVTQRVAWLCQTGSILHVIASMRRAAFCGTPRWHERPCVAKFKLGVVQLGKASNSCRGSARSDERPAQSYLGRLVGRAALIGWAKRIGYARVGERKEQYQQCSTRLWCA